MNTRIASSALILAATATASAIVDFNFSTPTQVTPTLFRYTNVGGVNQTDLYLEINDVTTAEGTGSATPFAA